MQTLQGVTRARFFQMPLEVPRDQYEQSVVLMKDHIRNGKVPGIKNPKDAEKLIRKGILSTEQMYRVGHAGTLPSLVYNAGTGSVEGLVAAAPTWLITYYTLVNKGASPKEAMIGASKASFKPFAKVTGMHIAVHQTELLLNDIKARGFKSTVKYIFSSKKKKLRFDHSVDAAIKKDSIILRSSRVRTNVLLGTFEFVATSTPRIVDAINGKISKHDCKEQLVVNGTKIVIRYVALEGGRIIGMTIGTWVAGPAGSEIGGKIGKVIAVGATPYLEKGVDKIQDVYDEYYETKMHDEQIRLQLREKYPEFFLFRDSIDISFTIVESQLRGERKRRVKAFHKKLFTLPERAMDASIDKISYIYERISSRRSFPKIRMPKIKLPRPKIKLPRPKIKLPKSKVKLPMPKIKLPRPKVKLPKPKIKLPKPKVKLSMPKIKLPNKLTSFSPFKKKNRFW